MIAIDAGLILSPQRRAGKDAATSTVYMPSGFRPPLTPTPLPTGEGH